MGQIKILHKKLKKYKIHGMQLKQCLEEKLSL